MKNNDFGQVAWKAFQEAAAEKYDFTTCQRSDGSYYGTGGTCRKGTETTKPEEKPKETKPKKLDASGVESLMSNKLMDSLEEAAKDHDMVMDDVAMDVIKEFNPADAKKLDKYDDMLYGGSLSSAKAAAQAKIEASVELGNMTKELEKAKESSEKAGDKWEESGYSDKAAAAYDKAMEKESAIKTQMQNKAAEFDPKTAKLIEQRDKLDEAWKKTKEDSPESEKALDKLVAKEGQINMRVKDLAYDTPTSRKIDKALDERADKVEKTIESVKQRRDAVYSRLEDQIGSRTWRDERAIYSAARGGPMSSEKGMYQKDSKQWTDQIYKSMKKAGYDVKKSDIKDIVEDTVLNNWGQAWTYKQDSMFVQLSDLT